MKIVLKSEASSHNLMRQCGYYLEGKDAKKGDLGFIRRLGVSGYPRFHAFVKVDEVSRETIINLHLDQKRPIYKGVPAHSAEYEGEVIEKERDRIKQILGIPC